MEFETCCQILELTSAELGVDPSKIQTLNLAQLEKIPEIIKNRYKKLSLKRHPDKGGTEAAFNKLCEAYKESTKFIEDLIKKQQNPLPSHTSQGDLPDWYYAFYNNQFDQKNTKQHYQPQQHQGDPRDWFSYFFSAADAQKPQPKPPFQEQTKPDKSWFNIFDTWNQNQNGINKFKQKVETLNRQLETEYGIEKDKIYRQAFMRFQQKKSAYFQEYKVAEYEKYVTQFAHNKESNKTKIVQNYQPLIARTNLWIFLGISFCFLGLPLVLSFFQWQTKKKLEAEQSRQLQTTEDEQPLSMPKWLQGNDISIEKWEKKFGFKNIDDFKNKSTTIEGVEASNAVKFLHTKLIDRKAHNQRIALEVEELQVSVTDAEPYLYQHLQSEKIDKPSQAKETRYGYGFRM